MTSSPEDNYFLKPQRTPVYFCSIHLYILQTVKKLIIPWQSLANKASVHYNEEQVLLSEQKCLFKMCYSKPFKVKLSAIGCAEML